MLLRKGWERRGGTKEAVEKRLAEQAGLCSQLCPFLAPLPLCLSFPTNKIKLDWMGIIPSFRSSNKLFVSPSTVYPHFRHC